MACATVPGGGDDRVQAIPRSKRETKRSREENLAGPSNLSHET